MTNSPDGMCVRPANNQESSEGVERLNLAIVILAKNEEKNIERFLNSLASQTLFDQKHLKISVYVVANGCTDQTATIAREKANALETRGDVRLEVLDWAAPGKSRSWNRVMHEVLPSDVQFIMAIDADIEFTSASVLSSMLKRIRCTPGLQVLSGAPIKDSARKSRPTLVDRFSLTMSRLTGHSGAVNGSLYLATAACLSEIWLPDDTPAEDGFLNAMVRTRGFSQPPQSNVIVQMSDPTHYFESHSAVAFFAHEKRIIVGTVINRWIFEYLHSLRLTQPAGPYIQLLNSENPGWIDKIIAERSMRTWLIPKTLLFRRLVPTQGLTVSYLLRLPLLLMATALTVPPAFMANRALKRIGAATLW